MIGKALFKTVPSACALGIYILRFLAGAAAQLQDLVSRKTRENLHVQNLHVQNFLMPELARAILRKNMTQNTLFSKNHRTEITKLAVNFELIFYMGGKR